MRAIHTFLTSKCVFPCAITILFIALLKRRNYAGMLRESIYFRKNAGNKKKIYIPKEAFGLARRSRALASYTRFGVANNYVKDLSNILFSH